MGCRHVACSSRSDCYANQTAVRRIRRQAIRRAGFRNPTINANTHKPPGQTLGGFFMRDDLILIASLGYQLFVAPRKRFIALHTNHPILHGLGWFFYG